MTKWEERELSHLLKSLPYRMDSPLELRQRLEELSSAVAWREFGLEKYMVLHIEQDDGQEERFLMEKILLSRGGCDWHVFGRVLKKDGSIGVKPAEFVFSCARVIRRTLDGTWQGVKQRKQCRGRHAYSSK